VISRGRGCHLIRERPADPGISLARVAIRSRSPPATTGSPEREIVHPGMPGRGRNCCRATSAPANRMARAQKARSRATTTPGASVCFPMHVQSKAVARDQAGHRDDPRGEGGRGGCLRELRNERARRHGHVALVGSQAMAVSVRLPRLG
jgi:hypothetical protein